MHASEKVQEHRKTDETDQDPNPAGNGRFDFYLPIFTLPATEPIEFTVRHIERCGSHSPKRGNARHKSSNAQNKSSNPAHQFEENDFEDEPQDKNQKIDDHGKIKGARRPD